MVLLVLKGYSSISCGRGMKALDQQKELAAFVLGRPPQKVSHAELLCQGVSDYSILYEPVPCQSLEDGKTEEVDGLRLRPELIVDYTRPYYAGVHIIPTDIKSSIWSLKVSYTTPKTLLSWARSAATDFRRADAFCSNWWDSVNNVPTKSGDSEDDVRRKVINVMWTYL